MRNGALIVAAVVSEVENNYSTTVEELVVLKVIRDVSLNKKRPSKIFMQPKGTRVRAGKISSQSKGRFH